MVRKKRVRKTKFKWYYTRKGRKHLTKKAKEHLSRKMSMAYRKKRFKRIEKIKLYRYSYAINFPLHNKYYGIMGQIWVKEKNEDAKDFIKEKTKEFLLKVIGYSKGDPWFDLALEGEGWQEVKEEKKFENYYELRYEDEEGRTLKREDGYYEA
jgi:hypothetical protein